MKFQKERKKKMKEQKLHAGREKSTKLTLITYCTRTTNSKEVLVGNVKVKNQIILWALMKMKPIR